MKKPVRLLIFASMLATQISCSSWLIRQECGKVNWYDHAYSIAMQGRRLTGDPTIDRCRKAEYEMPEQQMDVGFKAGMSNYCKPEIVFATGKKGDFFNTDLCDPGQANPLRQRHAEGVKAYCAVDNGFAAGASGKKYQNICPNNMEKGFLKEYNRGRKKYLAAVIKDAENETVALNSQVAEVERERTHLSYRLNLLPRAPSTGEKLYNPQTGLYEENDRYQTERNRLNNEISQAGARITEKRARQDKLRKLISDSEVEMAGLE